MNITYPEIGICGLSCVLCPRYNTDSASKCNGCKTQSRMGAGCPFITCAIKKKGVEFCWDCEESGNCTKWLKHRDSGKKRDSFTSYLNLEKDIAVVQEKGIAEHVDRQQRRAEILREMLAGYNDGRSKSYYCIAATVLDEYELNTVMESVRKNAEEGDDVRKKAMKLHALLDSIAEKTNISLTLRK